MDRFGLFIRKHLMMIRIYHLLSTFRGRDFDSLELLRKTAEKKGATLSSEQWEEFAWCWYAPLSNLGRAEEGIRDTLAGLRNSGLKLGILSNTFINALSLERHLDRYGIVNLFDVRLYSYQFNYRKPDRRIFIDAAAAIGVSPENTLFVGDRLDIDVKGSRRANMVAVLKNAYTNKNIKVPDNIIRIDKLAELDAVIEKINRGKEAYG